MAELDSLFLEMPTSFRILNRNSHTQRLVVMVSRV